MAVEQKDDEDLVHIDASDLFPAHTTWIGFRRGGLLRKYQLDFIQLFAPHLTRRLIERAASASTQASKPMAAGTSMPGSDAAAVVADLPHLRVIASGSAVIRCHRFLTGQRLTLSPRTLSIALNPSMESE